MLVRMLTMGLKLKKSKPWVKKKTQILDFARLRMSMVLRPDLKTQVLIFFFEEKVLIFLSKVHGSVAQNT